MHTSSLNIFICKKTGKTYKNSSFSDQCKCYNPSASLQEIGLLQLQHLQLADHFHTELRSSELRSKRRAGAGWWSSSWFSSWCCLFLRYSYNREKNTWIQLDLSIIYQVLDHYIPWSENKQNHIIDISIIILSRPIERTN